MKEDFSRHTMTRTFAADISPHMGARVELLRDWMPPGTRRILDLGCAFGYISSRLVTSNCHVHGVDAYMPFIKEAHATYPHISFMLAIAEALPFEDNSYDCVVMAEVLEHVTNDQRALQEVYRVLAPDGILLLTVPHSGPLSFLDLDNILYLFPRAHRYLYRLRWGNCQGFIPKTRQHRHYSVLDIEEKLDGNFVVEEIYLSGFIMFALASLLRNLVRGRVKSFLNSVMDWDYRHEYGAFATGLAMRLRKTNR